MAYIAFLHHFSFLFNAFSSLHCRALPGWGVRCLGLEHGSVHHSNGDDFREYLRIRLRPGRDSSLTRSDRHVDQFRQHQSHCHIQQHSRRRDRRFRDRIEDPHHAVGGRDIRLSLHHSRFNDRNCRGEVARQVALLHWSSHRCPCSASRAPNMASTLGDRASVPLRLTHHVGAAASDDAWTVIAGD
jgi:hypothetical protein